MCGCVTDNLVPFRLGLEWVEEFLGGKQKQKRKDGRVPKEEVRGGSERQNKGSAIANSPFNIFNKNIFFKRDIEDYLF